MKKKHIAMLISSLNKGGSERVLVNLAEYFYGRGYEVTVVTQYRTENEYEISGGIRRVFSEITEEEKGKGRISNFLKRFFKLRGIWKREKPDLILSFIGKNNMMAIMTSRFLGIPTIVSVRGEPAEEYYSRLLRAAAAVLFPLADGVVLPVEKSAEFFPKPVRRKVICLKNPLNPAFVRKRYEGEREKKDCGSRACGCQQEPRNDYPGLCGGGGQISGLSAGNIWRGGIEDILAGIGKGTGAGRAYNSAGQHFGCGGAYLQGFYIRIVFLFGGDAEYFDRSHGFRDSVRFHGLSMRGAGGIDYKWRKWLPY